MTEATPGPTPPATPPTKPSRLRRLWKWTKCLFLLFVVVLAVSTVIYLIHRQLAFRGGREALAAVRAELDANDPGWRYEDIEAAYNATLPPPGKNSVEIVLRLPVSKSYESLNLFTRDEVIESHSNEPPMEHILSIAREVETELPVNHPAIQELQKTVSGGFPLSEQFNLYGRSSKEFQEVTERVYPLQLAAMSAAARGDHRSCKQYLLALINSARTLGSLPRRIVQGRRTYLTESAARLTMRMLAWGSSKEDLVDLQREFLIEADRDWMKATLRCERAVIDREAPKMTRDDFFRSMLLGRTEATWEDHLMYRTIEPYREECLSQAIRMIGKDIDATSMTPWERIQRSKTLEEEERNESRTFPFHLFRMWRFVITLPTSALEDREIRTRTLLINTVVAISCERFRQKNNRWPKSLDEIPKDLLPITPLDPFDGKALTCRIEEECVTIQLNEPSIKNYKHGVLQTKTRVKLWNVELRGKKPPDPDALPNNDPDEKP